MLAWICDKAFKMFLTLVRGVSALKVKGLAHPALIFTTILSLRIGKVTLRLDDLSTKIHTCDLFVQFYVTLRQYGVCVSECYRAFWCLSL